ncbi:MAG: hypothetical protein JKY65_29365 [Planctomycetes bacterium]|nr:hypothetical protein [Planctomycetota bacterium]
MSRARAILRDATPADNAALCELFARVSMDGDLKLAVERGPNFFGLYEMQQILACQVQVGELEGRISGVATMLAREAWLEGKQTPVTYLGDLRLEDSLRGGFFLLNHFGEGFAKFLETTQSAVGLTAIIASNEIAIKTLTRRSRRFPKKPIYRPWRKFEITNLHFTIPRRPRPGPCEVRPARTEDLSAIAELLGKESSRQPFGYVLDAERLAERLRRWPGLTLDDFLCAWRGTELVGCAAVWDAKEVKRFRVEAYRGSMAWIRRAFNLGAFFLRYPALPPPGDVLPYAYLTHVAILNEDPPVFQALLDQAYTRHRQSGLRFLCACVFEDDPYAPAFVRYRTTPIPAQLFLVSPPDGPWAERELPSGRPGFEMALV